MYKLPFTSVKYIFVLISHMKYSNILGNLLKHDKIWKVICFLNFNKQFYGVAVSIYEPFFYVL